ncbi:hypothetical protein JTE90_003571 [Oedothorax gibbosus]|uniref:Uncharacterized protein n=1 Tax=Oedothorax gibbosus TaxID=931172 RepID=A0AAV6VIF1_9ARAC|nr:hypothetical protein JTE90_003571 [Oedothorax gibbosus]
MTHLEDLKLQTRLKNDVADGTMKTKGTTAKKLPEKPKTNNKKKNVKTAVNKKNVQSDEVKTTKVMKTVE